MRSQGREIVRAPHRGERFDPVEGGLPPIKPKPLGPEHFVRTEELQEALRGLSEPDPKKFFEEIDSVVDPTPRYWPECED